MTGNHTVHDLADGYVTVSCDCGWTVRRPAGKAANFAKARHRCAPFIAKAERAARAAERRAAIDARPPVQCKHGGRHQHGTPVMYAQDACRCRPCTTAAADKDRQRTRLIAYGQWNPKGNANRVRAHIEHLRSQGMGIRTIAAEADVPYACVARLARRVSGISHENARKLMAVKPRLGAATPVDATGTRRRVQALIAGLGWSYSLIAAEAGVSLSAIDRLAGNASTRESTRKAVADVYQRLWDQPPPGDAALAAERARRARLKGWLPPLAWDDIDNDAAPAVVTKATRTDKHAELIADVAFLAATGETWDAITKRTGRTQEAITTQLRRAGRDDVTRAINLTTYGPDQPMTSVQVRAMRTTKTKAAA